MVLRGALLVSVLVAVRASEPNEGLPNRAKAGHSPMIYLSLSCREFLSNDINDIIDIYDSHMMRYDTCMLHCFNLTGG